MRILPHLKIFLTLFAVTLPFFFIGGYAVFALQDQEREHVHESLHQAAQSTASAVGLQLALAVGHLQAMAASEAGQSGDVPALYAQAQRVMQGMPHAAAVSLIDAEKRLVFLTVVPLGTRSQMAAEPGNIEQVIRTRLPAVSGPFKSPVNDRIVSSVAVPVVVQGEVRYVLRLIFRATTLSEILSAQKYPADWTAALIAEDGRLVARSRAPEMFVGKMINPEVRAVLGVQGPSRVAGRTLEGEEVNGVVVRVPSWGWSVAVGAPKSNLQVARDRNVRLLVSFGIATAAFAGLLAFWGPRLWKSGHVDTSTSFAVGGSAWSVWPAVLALAGAIAVIATTATLTQAGVAQMKSRADQRLLASTQRAQVLELLASFTDLENGQRGFVISGRNNFLAPYESAIRTIRPLITGLRNSFSAADMEGFDWNELELLAEERQTLAARAIDERRSMGERVLRDVNLFDQGRVATDKIRLKLTALQGLLSRRVESLSVQLEEDRLRTTQTQWLAALVAGFLVAFSISFWLLERGRRQRLFNQLSTSHLVMEERVMERTAELRIASDRIRNFSTESERNIEAERKRLSREVHDQIGQVLTGIKMIVRTLRPGSLAPEQQQALDAAINMGIQTTRRISAELRPPLLDDLGLRAAIDFYLRNALSAAGLSYDLDIAAEHGLDSEQMTQLFRIVQEATTNVLRHAQASHITVSGRKDAAGFVLEVDDNGVGILDSARHPQGLGLIGIHERAQMLGGRAKVAKQPSGGTRLIVQLPQREPVA